MHIAMIGTGYVGLVSGACFADFGHDVTCVDKDAAKIAALKPRRDPDLRTGSRPTGRLERAGRPAAISRPISPGRSARPMPCSSRSARRRGAATAMPISATSTPPRARSPPRSTDFTVVITKSTVPVGTGDEVERIIREARPDCRRRRRVEPEFLREGAAIRDFKHPDRIVVGSEDERARKVMAELYRPLYLNQAPILFTGRRTAELTKYAANAFLATKITFINEIADLCEKVGADVQEVARGIGLDNRIGSKFLHAGPGFGGSCFPKDTVALIKTAQDHDVPLRIVETVLRSTTSASGPWRARSSAALGGSSARQDGRRARPDLQAQYRRHARGAVDPADHRTSGYGRESARLRSCRHGGRRRSEFSRYRILRRPLCSAPRRGRPGDRDRVGAISAPSTSTASRASLRIRSWSTCAMSTIGSKWRLADLSMWASAAELA